MKSLINTINNTTTFQVASEVATGLHFSITNLLCLYGIFTLGIVAIIPGATKLTDPAQRAIGNFAYLVGKKED
jgi:hypothetical protein